MTGLSGFLRLRESKKTLSFMATINSAPGRKWEHVSVGLYGSASKMPSWEDMCAVKDIFWNDEEEVHQIHLKKSQEKHSPHGKKNILHLWRPVDGWGDLEG